MGGMGAGPSPKQQLTTLVRKIDLLTGDVGLHLTPEQTADVLTAVQKLPNLEKMSDDEATAIHDDLMGVLNEDQKAREAAVSLPRRRGGGAGATSPGGPAAPPDPDLNPFKQEENLAAVQSLLQRFGVTSEVAADLPASSAEATNETAPAAGEATPTTPAAEAPAAATEPTTEPVPTTGEAPAAESAPASPAEPTPAAAGAPATP